MKNRDNCPETSASASRGQDLRQRAEEIAQEKKVRTACDLKVVSPDEAQQQLHELLVHQIELEMQNDELRRTQAELEDAKARYLDLYDLAPVGYCTLSENGLILETNLTAARLLGVPRSALINQPITRFIINEDQDVYYLYKRQLFGAGEPQTYELRMARVDGTVFWAHLVANDLLDAHGEWTSRITLSDITERKLKDEELKATKDSLCAEVEALNNLHTISTKFICQDNLQSIHEEILNAAIVMSHADKGKIQILDEQKSSLKIIMHSGFGTPYLKYYEKVSQESGTCGKAFQEKKRVIVDDVFQSPLFTQSSDLQVMLDEGIKSMQSTPMISSSGKILGILSTHYKIRHSFNERELRMFDLLASQAADILERTRVEEALRESENRASELVKELEQADQNKNEFIGVLSHELRNPLAAIVAGLSLLEITEDKQQRERAGEIIKRQIKQLCKLVDDLLDLTRITQNKIKIKKELINLNEVVINAIKDLEPEFEKKGVQLIVESTKRPVFLDADPVRITQAIGNLLFNALKYTERDGVVSLTLRNKKNEAEISIKDNGEGISPDMLAQLFKPFTQADNSIHRNDNGGLGLGLSIVKGIVDMHDGNVVASSEGLGKGAEFTILLPIKNENIEIDENAMTDDTKHNYRILIIEDNKDFANILSSMFDLLGHRSYAAYNGLEGIAKAKEIQPDVIFCDIGLPEIDGFEVAKRVRGETSIQDVYMVALTGYTNQSDIEKALESGFNKHLPKPIDIDTIRAVLNGILA